LIDIWKVSGFKPAELENHQDDIYLPGSPPHFPWVWEWFFELPSPITWFELSAWNQIAGIGLTRWEGELLIRLDHLRK